MKQIHRLLKDTTPTLTRLIDEKLKTKKIFPEKKTKVIEKNSNTS